MPGLDQVDYLPFLIGHDLLHSSQSILTLYSTALRTTRRFLTGSKTAQSLVVQNSNELALDIRPKPRRLRALGRDPAHPVHEQEPVLTKGKINHDKVLLCRISTFATLEGLSVAATAAN
jgi:hypothetical protein